GDNLFALIIVILRVFLVLVPRSGQAISAGHTDFRGDFAKEFEVIRMAATMAGPRRRSDGDRVSVRAGVDGMPRSMDLFVLLVRVFLVVDVRPTAEDRLDQVDTQRAPGSGPGLQLASGLLCNQPADVRKDDDHEVSVRPHPEG